MDASRIRFGKPHANLSLTPLDTDLYFMCKIDFAAINSKDDIARYFACSPFLIDVVLQRPSVLYELIHIPKKGKYNQKKYRTVYEVKPELSNLQKNIATAISTKIEFPDYVQGFVNKRSIASNASLHLAKKYVLNLDIKDFFDSISKEKVSLIFKELGCTEEIADIFASLCTLNAKLVQGASTSPILANLVCGALDREFAELGKQYECSYSRYADDITFSGEKIPRKKDLEKCLKKYEFQLNPDKWKVQYRGRAQYVTGLTVFDNIQPRIPKAIKSQLRQIIYYASKYGLDSHLAKLNCDIYEIRRIDGLIAFMYSVEPKRAWEFDKEWQKIIAASPFSIVVLPRNPDIILKRHLTKQATLTCEN